MCPILAKNQRAVGFTLALEFTFLSSRSGLGIWGVDQSDQRFRELQPPAPSPRESSNRWPAVLPASISLYYHFFPFLADLPTFRKALSLRRFLWD